MIRVDARRGIARVKCDEAGGWQSPMNKRPRETMRANVLLFRRAPGRRDREFAVTVPVLTSGPKTTPTLVRRGDLRPKSFLLLDSE